MAGQDFLEELSKKERDFWHSNKDRIFKKLIKGDKILEIGCGSGSLIKSLSRDGREIIGLDISEEYLELAKKKCEGLNVTLIKEDILEFDTEEKFDSIVMLGVIEHIEDDVALLKKINKWLVPGGELYILTSAYPRLYSKYDENIGHYRRYSKKGLSNTLKEGGFSTKKVKYWDALGIPAIALTKSLNKIVISPNTLNNKVLDKSLDIWFRLVENHMPFPFGLNLIVVAEK